MGTDSMTLIEKLLGVCPMCRRKFRWVGTYDGNTACFTCNQIKVAVDLVTDRMNRLYDRMDDRMTRMTDCMDQMFVDMGTLEDRIEEIDRKL